MERTFIDEAMKLNKTNLLSSTVGLRMLSKHAFTDLKSDEKYNLFYECKIEDLLKSDINEEELIEAVTKGGWEYSKDKKFLIKYI